MYSLKVLTGAYTVTLDIGLPDLVQFPVNLAISGERRIINGQGFPFGAKGALKEVVVQPALSG